MAIVVVGSINTDLVVRVREFPIPGETIYGDDFSTFGGGKGANQAAAAGRLSANVSMFGAVGNDEYGSQRLQDLTDAGVDVSSILIREGTTSGIALIQVDQAGQNQIVVIAGANGTVTPDDIECHLPSMLNPGDLMLAQLELPFEAVRRSLEIAGERGATRILNTAPIIERSKELLSLVDILVVNEIEAGRLLDRGPVSVGEASDACEQLRRTGPEIVFATLGSAGAVISDELDTVRVPAPAVDVVDTTGAGDASVGAFAAALADKLDIADAARVAVMAGSFAVQRRGAQASQATREELDAFIAQQSTRIDPR